MSDRLEVTSFRRIDKKGNNSTTLGFFNFIDFDTGLEYKDFVLIDAGGQVFAKSPQTSWQGEDGMVYSPYIQPAFIKSENAQDELGMEWFDEVTDAAFEAYESAEVAKPKTRGRSSGGGGGRKRSSGRSSGQGSSGTNKSRSGGRGRRSTSEKAVAGGGRKSSRRSGRGPTPPRVDEDMDDNLPEWPESDE